MRLVLISDTHGLHRQLPPLPEGDVLIHAGDFMRSGKYPHEVGDFAEWFSSQQFPTKILIAGNHDLLMQSSEGIEGAQWLGKTGIIYLEDSGIYLEEYALSIWGSPWTTRFMNWAFMSERGPEMKKHWDLIPDDTDVLITHGPPQGIMDSLPAYRDNLGCADLRDAVARVKPRLHVFGHIHFGYGDQQIGDIRFVNAAQLDDGYRIAHLPVIVDLD